MYEAGYQLRMTNFLGFCSPNLLRGYRGDADGQGSMVSRLSLSGFLIWALWPLSWRSVTLRGIACNKL